MKVDIKIKLEILTGDKVELFLLELYVQVLYMMQQEVW